MMPEILLACLYLAFLLKRTQLLPRIDDNQNDLNVKNRFDYKRGFEEKHKETTKMEAAIPLYYNERDLFTRKH